MENSKQAKYTVVHGIREDKPWFSTVLEDYKNFKGRLGLDWLLEIRVGVEGLNNLLPSKDEANILNQFEDMLEEIFKGIPSDVFFIVRTTWNGLRSIFYRVSDPESVSAKLDELIDQEKYPREFEYKITKDSDWKVMSDIIPH